VDITYFQSGYIDDTYFVYTADAQAELSTSSNITCDLTARPIIPNHEYGIQLAEANLTSRFSTPRLVLDGTTRYIDPFIISGANYGGIGFDSTIKKFGASLRFDARNNGGSVDFGPVYGNGKFIALSSSESISNAGPNTRYTYSSTDGITWTTTTNNLPEGWSTNGGTWIKYLNNQFIIKGSNLSNNFSPIFYTSTDGITWSAITPNINSGFYDIIYNSGYYFAVGTQSVTTSIHYSTNLSTWTTTFSDYVPNDPRGLNAIAGYPITYTDPVYGFDRNGFLTVAVGYDSQRGPMIDFGWDLPPTTRETWRQSYVNVSDASLRSKQFLSVATDGNQWVFVGSGGIIYTARTDDLEQRRYDSNHQVTFYSSSSGTTEDIIQVVYNNGLFVARTSVDSNHQSKILISANGTNWSIAELPFTTPSTTTPWIDGTRALDGNQFYSGIAYGNSTWVVNDYYNFNNSSWRRIDFDGQLPNRQPSVYYEPGQYLNLWRTLDFWLYIENSDYQYVAGVLYQQDINSAAGFSIEFTHQNNNNTVITINEQDSSGNTAGNYIAGGLHSGQWNHIRVVHSDTAGAIFFNGSKVGTTFAPQGTLGYNNSPMYIGRFATDVKYSRGAFYIDEFLLTRDLLSQPTDTTYTVPTTPWGNGPNVTALLHFNNDIDDDNLPWNGGYLASTSSIRASLGKSQFGQANLTSTSTLSAQVIRTKQFADLMVDNFTLTANATRIRRISAQLNVTSRLTGVEQVTDSVEARLTSTSSVRAVLGHISQATAQLNSISQLQAAVLKIRRTSAQLSSQSTFTASAERYRLVTGSGNLISRSTLQSNTVKTAGFTSRLHSTSTFFGGLNNVATTKQFGSNMSSHFTIIAAGGKSRIDTSLVWYIEYEDRGWVISPETLSNYTVTH